MGKQEVRRRTIVGGYVRTMDEIDENTLDRHAVDEKLTILEREINTAVADLSRTIEEKYILDAPQAFVASESALRKVQRFINEASMSLAQIDGSLKDMSDAPSLSGEESAALRLGIVSELRSRLMSLIEIEDEMGVLWRMEITRDPLRAAKTIKKVEKLMDDIVNEEGASDIFADRIHPALCEELLSRETELSLFLDNYFHQRFSFLSYEHVDPDVWTMKISPDDREIWSRCFTAMNVIGKLNTALSLFATTFCERFCEAVITNANCAEKFEYRSVGGSNTFLIPKLSNAAKSKRPEASVVFKQLSVILRHLAENIGDTVVGEEKLLILIGDCIHERLMKAIVKDTLTPAIPFEKTSTDTFSVVLEDAKEFQNSMIGKLFRDRTESLEDFCQNHSKVFIDRRCLKIMTEARALISKPYVDMIEVGKNDDAEEEEPGEYAATVGDLQKEGHGNRVMTETADEYLPKLYRFQKCKISTSIFELVKLLNETLVAAGEAYDQLQPDGGMQSAALYETARNIVTMFLKIAPVHHKVAISSVPQIAAVFYNNCYYICHRLMTAGFDAELLMKNNSGNGLARRVNFVEFFGELRTVAADVLEQHLANCRRQISTILSDDNMFVGLHEEQRYKKTEKTMLSVKMQLQQIATVWREVLTDTVYAESLGNVISHLLLVLSSIVLSKEDIHSRDTEFTASLLSALLSDLENLMKICGYTLIHRVCEKSYYKMKEIIFCLNGNLQEIADRWCEGKGPLAQWVSADQVRKLIRALYQNTERRAALLSTIH
ncbi:hypothetical protein QR680_017580 [Steinernema hermaphroditum]|uniref:Centromere/kinetochore protein zw10 homolog n=1 Tax=Steinernema hermaphroditum TaxID=289476 RepID=A0AA39HG31_9BILA|nr:hypothetical protein QR680_017580 [Steinernema hermaphroditum]